MTNEEKRIYLIGILAIIPLLCMILAVLFPEHAAAESEVNAHITEGPSGFPDEMSAMPCCSISTIKEEKEIDDEPETSKETDVFIDITDTSASEDDAEMGIEQTARYEKEMETDLDCSEEDGPETGCVIYKIAGEMIPEEIQKKLYEELEAAEIDYWYEAGLCQIFQESHGNSYAENPNGLDKGILQYRVTYWDNSNGDIFDYSAQIRLYAQQMAARLNAGLSTDEAISRHKTSDYCTSVDWMYVEHVRQWIGQMEEVK